MIRRRELLHGMAGLGASILGSRAMPAAAEPPPETTRIRVHQNASLCQAPQYVAEELLKSEGFADVQ
jgi:NitT/TauT family transport system substrate-binding protein